MAESADYDPGPWQGHDFKSARKAYDAYAGRSYGDAVKAKKTTADLLPDFVATDSPSPLSIICDVTGSMGEWPATIFSKLPYLDLEGKQYLGEGMEICFAAVGDYTCDKYPLQFRPFTKGLDLEKQLKQLVIEGGGGGQTCESYEMAALYVSRNIKTPKATRRPIVILIGDEAAYDYVDKAAAQDCARVNIRQRISTKAIFDELKEKASVYIVRKPYEVDAEARIKQGWIDLLGEDHVVPLADANRVVDVIFGILAQEVNKVDYFRLELEGRQTPAQVATVYESLATVHAAKPNHTGRSVLLKPGTGLKSRSLLDE